MLVETEAHFLEDSKILSHSTGLHFRGLRLACSLHLASIVQSSPLASPEGKHCHSRLWRALDVQSCWQSQWGPPSPGTGCRDLV